MDGRWPANVILSPEMAEVLDQQSGITKSTVDRNLKTSFAPSWFTGTESHRVSRGDVGGASRFFLNAGYEPWELEWILANGLRPHGA